jgi:ubiquinone/menaquinone biosynthesis C-methylase UbiE
LPFNQHFRLFAPYYDKIIKNKDESSYIKHAELPVSGRLLEIGGGTARITSSFKGMVDQITNVDITFQMLKVAMSKGIPSICSQGENLPFEDGKFARILIIDSIHHINHQSIVISEAIRVLSSDGIMLIVEPTYDKFSGLLVRIFERALFMGSNFLKDGELMEMLNLHTPKVKLHHHNGNSWFVARKIT